MADNYSFARSYFFLALIATLLTFCVVLLGAYTRLKDAGLGCPDWPGCYGQITVPHTPTEIMRAVHLYPAEPVEPQKAWPEMIHRYFAGTLGLLIFVLAIGAVIRRCFDPDQPLVIPLLLACLVVFQAALGMWTVTWKLLPLIVMGHLLGGMTILALLWWLTLKIGKLWANPLPIHYKKILPWAIIGLMIVGLQIFLGGWTSANYASLACANFPFCDGGLFPPMDFHRAFNFLSPIGANYQGGMLDMTARVTIQMTHRYGAFITFFYIGFLALYLLISKEMRSLRILGIVILIILLIQLLLGAWNVIGLLPLHVALAHNAFAALLLLSLVTLIYKLNNHLH